MPIREADEELHFFESAAAFRRWLTRHHAKKAAVWVGFHKKATGKPTLSWPESVDEALCYGWIDGIRKSVSDEAYKIRFTPRKASSFWSAINVARVAELTKLGRMRPEGLEAFGRRQAARTAVYSHEQSGDSILDPTYEQRLRSNARAWEHFQSRPPWYRKAAIRWVMTAKRESTRESRLARLESDSAAGKAIPPLRRPPTR